MFMPSFRLRSTISRQVLAAALCATWLVFRVSGSEGQTEATQKLIAVLSSDAGLFEKARACQQLGEFGSKEAVPALAALLNNEHLSAYARSGLEGIPDPSAAAALRAALGSLTGNQLAGVINSLGVLQDTASVPLLQPLTTHPESGVAKEALLALGHIANAAAIRVVRETLAGGGETVRPAAASACLLAAERQLADGHARMARRLYDAVRQTEVSPACRAAATRGAILARKSGGPAFLVQQLDSPDPVLRNAALMTIPELPSHWLEKALIAKMETASPELQVQLLATFANWRNPDSVRAVKARTRSDDAEVRKMALMVLGQIGGPAETGVFLSALRQNRSAEETSIALRNLESIQDPEVDTQVLQALAAENEPANQVRLIRLVSARGMASATAELFRQTRDPDHKVSIAALGALGAVAGLQDLPALIAFTRSCSDEAIRGSAAGAIVRLCQKSGNLEAEEAALIPEVEQATDAGPRTTWLDILVKIGSAKALPLLETDLRSTNSLTVDHAKQMLETLAATVKDNDLRQKAAAAAASK